MEQTSVLFIQLAAVLGVASVLGFFVRFLKLPLLVAYLVAGLLFALLRFADLPLGKAGFSGTSPLSSFPEIGIAFVLFFVGMEMGFSQIRTLGWPIVTVGLGQMFISGGLGFLLARLLGFGQPESLLLGIGLSFSSTIVVIKLLLEKKELSSLYGKLSVGILLLEDLVAVVILMGMSVSRSVLGVGLSAAVPMVMLLVKAVLLLFLALGLSRYVLRGVFRAVSSSTELLFLTALSWCFIFVSVSVLLGFSVLIGAFLAGVALAGSPFYWEIQGKVRPLRDFFVVLFFVYLGSQVEFGNISTTLPLILVFTFYALVAKPLIFLFLLGAFGFRKHTIFQVALSLTQISEFSLILIVVGMRLGWAGQEGLTAIALAAVFSIMASSVMIVFSRKLYRVLGPVVSLFERGKFVHQVELKVRQEYKGHVVLIGAHRMGGEIIRFLKRERIPVVVVDFNPRVIQNLVNEKIPAMYGDVGDPEILEFLNIESARIVVSTAPSLDDNLILLAQIKRRGVSAPVLVRASSVSDAKTLYAHGADYVILPEIVSGEFVMQTLRSHWDDLKFFKDRADLELARLFRNKFAFE